MKKDRKQELLSKSVEELNIEQNALKRILFNLRFKKARQELSSTHLLRQVRKEIAFVLMLIKQKAT